MNAVIETCIYLCKCAYGYARNANRAECASNRVCDRIQAAASAQDN
jgi:hypothetical protein